MTSQITTQFCNGNTVIIESFTETMLFKLIAVNGWNKTERHSTISGAMVGFEITDVNGNSIGFTQRSSLAHRPHAFVTNWERLEVKPHEIIS